ncbi:sugar ABC transporter permease [Cohnella endophytica]|uniref:Sugar ABC transporter permease n=1 Tax=Cohnella endophytica TaxID=2419778 RepID=A0A494XUC5_9BACL|nr:sugar ABC transporter permease [Cohnella endophytica]RKP54168.1 sugar ABC transporter permease [Cohnella endophytica]
MRNSRTRIKLFVSYVLLVVISIICLYPAVWIVVSAFRPGGSIYSPHFLPERFTTEHFSALFNDKSFVFGRWYRNTLKIAIYSTIFGTLGTTMVAYVLSRFRFKARRTALSTILVLTMFPNFMSLVAVFLLFYQFNLLDTHTALILVYSCGAPIGGTFIVKGFFDTIPRSLEESAHIDGASHMTVFTRIMLPLCKPILIYTSLMIFTGAWVDFVLARFLLRSREQWTVAVGLWDLATNFRTANFTMFAAGCVLVALPITILFMMMQRFIVEGLTSGANKG